jgi:hypothetical protein
MTKVNEQIRVGAGGSIYVAALSATPTLPTVNDTDPLAALEDPFKELGYATEEGVTFRDGRTIQTVKAWQSGGYPVRKTVTEYESMLSFELMQWAKDIIEFALDAVVSKGTEGYYKITPTRDGVAREYAMVIDWGEGDYHYRIVIPRGVIEDAVEIGLTAEDTANLPVAFGAVAEVGVAPWYIITDDPSFDPDAS